MEQKPLVSEKTLGILRTYVGEHQAEEAVKIPSERELAKSLEVSRVSIRTALKKLVEDGLLTQTQGRGTYITPRPKPVALHILCPPGIRKTDPFYNKFLVEITREAAIRQLYLYVIDPDKLLDNKEGAPLITIGIIDWELIDRLDDIYKTIISIQDFSNNPKAVHLMFDDYAIGKSAGELLLQMGHERIMQLSGPEKYPSAVLRRQGFRDSVVENGGDSGCSCIEYCAKMNLGGGYSAAEFLLKELSRAEWPTGIFAANDSMALGFILRLKEAGVEVPGEISVIGCDDIQLAAEFEPGLTTFNLDMKLIVNEIFTMLMRQNSGASWSGRIMIPAKLVQRDSLRRIV